MNKKEVILILKLLSERLFFSVHIRYAHDGFGCQPHAIGRSIRCICLGDGEETRWNRTDFTGVLKDEFLPDWASEKLKELSGQKNPDLQKPIETSGREQYPSKGPTLPDRPTMK